MAVFTASSLCGPGLHQQEASVWPAVWNLLPCVQFVLSVYDEPGKILQFYSDKCE